MNLKSKLSLLGSVCIVCVWVVRRAESYHGDRLRGGLYARGWLLRPLHLVRLPLVLCFRVRLGDQYVGQEGKQTQSLCRCTENI